MTTCRSSVGSGTISVMVSESKQLPPLGDQREVMTYVGRRQIGIRAVLGNHRPSARGEKQHSLCLCCNTHLTEICHVVRICVDKSTAWSRNWCQYTKVVALAKSNYPCSWWQKVAAFGWMSRMLDKYTRGGNRVNIRKERAKEGGNASVARWKGRSASSMASRKEGNAVRGNLRREEDTHLIYVP